MPELTGTYAGHIFRSTDEDSDFMIGKLKLEDGEMMTILGEAADGKLISGVPYRFSGDTVYSQKYDCDQFKFKHFVQLQPISRRGVVAYLEKNAKGIGPTIAARLWDAYGKSAIKKLRLAPYCCAEDIVGLSDARALEGATALRELVEYEETNAELLGLLGGRGFEKIVYELLIKHYGCEAPSVVKKDPFKMVVKRYKSASFNRCDQMYLDHGGNPAKLKRQMLFLWDQMQRNSSGDTWFSIDAAINHMRGTIGDAILEPEKAIELGLRAGWLAVSGEGADGEWITTRKMADDEGYVATKVRRMVEYEPSPRWPSAMPNMSEHQQSAMLRALSWHVGCLVGYAGTGKTHCIASLLESMSHVGLGPVAVCAPTGKASVQLTEYFEERGLPHRATTIHRLLGAKRGTGHGSEWQFSYNQLKPLPFRYVIVDEMSMVAVPLLADLLRAMKAGSHLLLTGDVAQLPPIDNGCPMRDLMKVLPVGELTEVRRNQGEGVRLCQAVRTGQEIDFQYDGFDLEIGANAIHIDVSRPNEVRRAIQQILTTAVDGFDPIWDMQVACPLNKQGDLSRRELSIWMQGFLNPAVDDELTCNVGNGMQLRLCDKVMCTENNEMLILNSEDDEKDLVANGEIGKVVFIWEEVSKHPTTGKVTKTKWMAVEFDAPKRTVKVTGSLILRFTLAYAITIHKSQGAQSPYVIYVIDDSRAARRVSSKQLVYTEMSRYQTAMYVIGKLSTLRQDCKIDALSGRKTLLVERF